MGANYYTIIKNLITLKNELYRVEDSKFASLINELKQYQIKRNEDDIQIPSLADLEQKLGYKRPRISSLIKGLNYELIRSLGADPPIQIKQVVHHICIRQSSEETWHMPRKRKDIEQKFHTWITIELPRTPSIGDTIFIRFIEDLDKYIHGTVHEVEHNIFGDCQEVYIEVHPFKNYYHKWVSLKERYERDIKPDRY
jgi:hypothetical protein